LQLLPGKTLPGNKNDPPFLECHIKLFIVAWNKELRVNMANQSPFTLLSPRSCRLYIKKSWLSTLTKHDSYPSHRIVVRVCYGLDRKCSPIGSCIEGFIPS
jgi:hypothetical protein